MNRREFINKSALPKWEHKSLKAADLVVEA